MMDAALDWRRRLDLFPDTISLEEEDNQLYLRIGGCSLQSLAEEFGTPLYVYDRATLDQAVDGYREALKKYYPAGAGLTYAGKAFLCTAIAQWAQQRGLYLDCSSAGELYIAKQAGVERERLVLHGVNKSGEDLQAALDGAGILVIDNLAELERFISLQRQSKQDENPSLWLRWRPGLAVETHQYTQTGQEDSKFGMNGAELEQAVRRCQEAGLLASGIHFHQGSHFHNPEPLRQAIALLLDLLVGLRDRLGWLPESLCPGGGWGVAYHEDELPQPDVGEYVSAVSEEVQRGCEVRCLPLLRLVLEPGRSLVARAGVAIYQVGTVKHSAQRRWLLLDGGLADNPRPALYQARYSALPVLAPERPFVGPAWLGGPYCESGDVLIEGLPLPEIAAGELIAVPVSGAYQLSMGSNYNGARKPVVVMVEAGKACLIQRRQSLEDLVKRDVSLSEEV